MTKREFIEQVAAYVKKYAPEWGVKIYSPVIAQAILESGWGESKLANKYHNYFGLKAGINRWTGPTVNMATQEEYQPGTMTTISDNFRVYGSLEEGVQGYFVFLFQGMTRYNNLKSADTPELYLKYIKADGYATASSYVSSCMQIIREWNLTRYDPSKYSAGGSCVGNDAGENADASENADPDENADAGENTEVRKERSSMDFSRYYGMISNSGHDERGSYSGGKAGDQTGTEWEIRAWYNRPWNAVLRHPRQDVRERLAELAIKAAGNNRIGYNQYARQSYFTALQKADFDPSKITEACDADCSAGVIANTKAAGYLLGIPELQNTEATYTGNMRECYRKAGFQVLTDPKYLNGYDYLMPGDILLNDIHHTATNLGIGGKSGYKVVETAPSSETVLPSCAVPSSSGSTSQTGGSDQTDQTDASRLYHVQFGTYSTKEDADRDAAMLRQNGLGSYVYQKDQWFILQEGCYADLPKAQKQLSEIERKLGVTGVIWYRDQAGAVHNL